MPTNVMLVERACSSVQISLSLSEIADLFLGYVFLCAERNDLLLLLMVLGTWQKRVVGLAACQINLLTGHWKVYPMVEEAVQGAEAGAGDGVDVEGEEEEAFGKLDAFPPDKR